MRCVGRWPPLSWHLPPHRRDNATRSLSGFFHHHLAAAIRLSVRAFGGRLLCGCFTVLSPTFCPTSPVAAHLIASSRNATCCLDVKSASAGAGSSAGETRERTHSLNRPRPRYQSRAAFSLPACGPPAGAGAASRRGSAVLTAAPIFFLPNTQVWLRRRFSL